MPAPASSADNHGKKRQLRRHLWSAPIRLRRARPGSGGVDASGPEGPLLAQPAVPNAPHPVELAGLLHELTALLLAAENVEDALDRLARLTAGALPAALRCSVTLIGDGTPVAAAACGAPAEALDDLQYVTNEGPGLDATRGRTVVTCPDLTTDDRWPTLARCAKRLGVHSVASVPLDVQRNAVGSLTVFVARRDGIDPHLLITAMAVAGQAEVLLAEVLRRSAQTAAADDLAALQRGGAIVDHAVGVIVAQRGCGLPEAYAILHETSQRLNVAPQTVAERLVQTAARRAE